MSDEGETGLRGPVVGGGSASLMMPATRHRCSPVAWCYERPDSARALNKRQTTTMVSPFSTDDAEENAGTREDFIARVVKSEVDAENERFQSDYDQDIDILYELDVLDHDWENLYELGINVRKSLGSKWMLIIGSLENIHGPEAVRQLSSLQDLAEFLNDKVYKFKDYNLTADEDFVFQHKGQGETINFEDVFGDLDNPPGTMALPVEEVTDEDKLADLGANEDTEVDEYEF
jgi:hypothetical protein